MSDAIKEHFRSVVVHLLLIFLMMSGKALAADRTRVMTFGDSITQGYPYIRAPANGGHFGPMQIALEELHRNNRQAVFVLNYGHGGESTTNGLERIESKIRSMIAAYGGIEYVLLVEGANDFNYGYSSSTTAFNLGAMVDTIRRYSTPILGTLTPDTASSAHDVPAYNAKIRSMASSKGVILVDHYDLMAGSWAQETVDGIHPNIDGYNHMARNWYEVLEGRIPFACVAKPVIISFTASSGSVSNRSPVTLSWEVSDAESIKIVSDSGEQIDVSAKEPGNDSVVISAVKNATYTLLASNLCDEGIPPQKSVTLGAGTVAPWLLLLLKTKGKSVP